ncbi:MAG: helicase HerA-like domain-containing protein [Acidimicrobiales bacterium]
MERPPGHLFLGETVDAASGQRTGTPVLLDSADLTTHGVIVGMTGSGKTGLGVVLIEEARLAGIPVLAIDPKGDLGNLCLTFPNLAPADFEPWIDAGTARVQNTTVADLAATTATDWRDGLASWGLGPADIAALARSGNATIYTPSSTAGVGLNLLGQLSAPSTTDPGARQDELDATVTGLLGLVGIDSDPLSGREHVLMANLLARAWDAGTPLDLGGLLGQILDPPIRKLGVLDLDTFFPPADRQALALKLNGLVASPSFARWAAGDPLDVARMLWDAEGRARTAIVSLGHLEETERQFVVTLVLSKLISWMRTQPGTGELRALVYLDEVMGLAPPVGNPPAKKPILTLLKQARAFGVGLVLATQNPVDLDYKAISNAGTWLIGRLQTEQDKNRLVDGLRSADGATDLAAVESTISNLGKRQFMLRSARNAQLPRLTSRWSMSYLAGPLTGDQISRLMHPGGAAAAATAPPAEPAPPPASGSPSASATPGPTPAAAPTASPASAPTAAAPPSAASSAAPAPALADDESPVAPGAPDSLPVRYLAAAAPWLATVGATASGTRLVPALAARVNLLFDDTKAALNHREEWEAVIPLDGDQVDVGAAVAVDFDDRDFTPTAPAGARYVLPGVKLTASLVSRVTADLRARLTADRQLVLHHNPELKLVSRPDETAEQFAARCQAAADEGADAEAAKVRDRLDAKRDAIQAALAKAQDRVAEIEAAQSARRESQMIDIGASVLGSLLGGRGRARQLASAARRMSSGRGRAAGGEARLASARNRVAEKVDELDDLERDVQEALMDIDQEWSAKAAAVQELAVGLEKADVTVEDLMLVWLPTAG